MPKRLVEFSLKDQGIILVEVDEPAPEVGVVRAARPGELAEQAKETFEAALEKIKPAATIVIDKLSELDNPPDSIQVEFGIKLSAAAGAFLASIATESNFRVTLTWKHTQT
jgi:Trypsin-co-occurring domain 1